LKSVYLQGLPNFKLRFQTVLTPVGQAPMHVEQAPRRREAMEKSGRRRGDVAGEVEPGHGGWIVNVKIVRCACRQTGCVS
jgi:hypothetical protein